MRLPSAKTKRLNWATWARKIQISRWLSLVFQALSVLRRCICSLLSTDGELALQCQVCIKARLDTWQRVLFASCGSWDWELQHIWHLFSKVWIQRNQSVIACHCWSKPAFSLISISVMPSFTLVGFKIQPASAVGATQYLGSGHCQQLCGQPSPPSACP